MKTLLILALFVSSADASVFAYRQSASQSGNAALAFPSNNVAANMIVVATSTIDVTAVNDTQNNSYTLLSTQTHGSGAALQVWVALNIKAGANSVTATGLHASGANSSIAIVEYTVPSSFATIAANGDNSNTGTPINGSGTFYNSANESLLVIAAYDYHSSHSWTGTNLTVRETTSEAGGQTMSIGDFDTASSTFTTISTLNGCTDTTNACVAGGLFNFQGGSGGGAPSASAFVGLQ